MTLEQKDRLVITNNVAEHTSAMIAYWDKSLICRFANKAYLRWYGIDHQEMYEAIPVKQLLGPLYEKNLPFIMAALQGKYQTFEREVVLRESDKRSTLVSYYPDIVNGSIEGIYVHIADITALKKESEPSKADEVIGRQNKLLLNFANVVTHNLKSYSNNLASILQFLADAASDDEKTRMLDFLNNISKGFSITINHLTEIVKIQNEINVNFEKVSLHDFCEKAMDILEIQIRSEKAVIKNNIPTELTLSVNPAYLESILLNFLTNALKYRHPDRNPVISLDAVREDNRIILSISDNGVGLNLDTYGSELFGMYKTFHGNPDAVGIGLFIAKYQIESMGGQVEVESREGEGSTFRIVFKVN